MLTFQLQLSNFQIAVV